MPGGELSGFAAGFPWALIRLQAAKEGVQAGGEALVAVVGPAVRAVDGQGGEALAGRERRNACSSCLVAASRRRRSAGDVGSARAKPDGVVVDEAEGQGGLVAGLHRGAGLLILDLSLSGLAC